MLTTGRALRFNQSGGPDRHRTVRLSISGHDHATLVMFKPAQASPLIEALAAALPLICAGYPTPTVLRRGADAPLGSA
jgi:hypothetical protein